VRLSTAIALRFRDFLPLSTHPMRVGMHFNTAFGLRMAADHASITRDGALGNLLRETGMRWYGEDTDCPAWGEPSGDDLQSSALSRYRLGNVLFNQSQASGIASLRNDRDSGRRAGPAHAALVPSRIR
jgi:hypothetical protein